MGATLEWVGAFLKGLWKGLVFLIVTIIIPGTLWYSSVNTTNASQDKSIFEHARQIEALKTLQQSSAIDTQKELRVIDSRLSRIEALMYKIYKRDE